MQNLSPPELRFQAEEEALEVQKVTPGLDFALRCHFDRYATNQS